MKRFRSYTVEVTPGMKSEGLDGQVDFAERRVEIGAHLRGRAELETIVHELLHVLAPTWSERRVERAAFDMATLLYSWGYRKA